MGVRSLKEGEEVVKSGPSVRPLREDEEVITSQDNKDLPEFGSLSQFGPMGEKAGTGAQIAAGFVTTPDPESRKDIIQKAIPGTEFSEDEDGNTVIKLPDGKRAYLNKPGLSMQDFTDFASDVVKFLPSAKFASGGKTLLSKLGRGAFGGATTSAAEDVAAIPQGSEEGIKPGKAGVTAVADMAGEGVGRGISASAKALKPVLRRAFGSSTNNIMQDGQLTPAARKAVEKAGMGPDQVTPEMARQAVRAIDEGVPEENVAGVATARRFDVPLTRGEQTGDFQQLAREEDLAGRTDEAGNIMREGRQRKARRSAEAAGEMEQNLGGGRPQLANEAEAGARIGENVQSEAQRLNTQIDEAFDEASGKQASLNRQGLDRLSSAAETLRSDPDVLVDEELTPATMRALNEIDSLTGEGNPSKTIQQVETTRRRLNQYMDAAKNNTDRRGVTQVKRRFDQYLDDAFDNALFEGDEEALNALKNARNLRAEYGRRFQENTRRGKGGQKKPDPGGKAVQSIVENDPTDEQVVNMIFGRSRVFSPDNAAKTIDALRKATDNNEEVNNTLKQMTFRRIASQAIDDGQFSPKKFVSAFERVKKENPTVLNKVFSEDERKALNEFRELAKTQIKPDGVVNNSKTAQTLVRLMGRLGAVVGLQQGGIGMGAMGGTGARNIAGVFERKAAKGAAEDAINPQFLLSGKPNAALISSSIAAARNEEVQEEADKRSGQAVEAVRGLQRRSAGPSQQ